MNANNKYNYVSLYKGLNNYVTYLEKEQKYATKMSNNNDDLYIRPFRTNGMFLALKVYRFIDNKFMLMMGAAFLPGIATLTNRSIGCFGEGGARR